MSNEKGKFFQVGTPLCGLVCGLVGAIIALMLLFFGFWRTVFVAALFAVGYFVGACANKTDTVKRGINKVFPPKAE